MACPCIALLCALALSAGCGRPQAEGIAGATDGARPASAQRIPSGMAEMARDDMGMGPDGGLAPDPDAQGAPDPDAPATAGPQPNTETATDGGPTDPPVRDGGAMEPSAPGHPSQPVQAEPVACPGPSAADLALPEAGSGARSGCPPRTCVGDRRVSLDEARALTTDLDRYTGCTTVAGDLLVLNAQQTDLHQLSCLEHVSGSLVVWNAPRLQNLDGLSSLERVGDDLRIGIYLSHEVDNDSLTRIDALSALQIVGRDLRVSVKHTGDLHGLEGLRLVGQHAFVEGGFSTGQSQTGVPNRAVEDLSGLSGLSWIGGGLQVGTGIHSTRGLTALSRVGQDLVVGMWARELREVTGFPALTCIGRSLRLSGSGVTDAAPTRLDAFPRLTEIGYHVVIVSWASMQEMNPLAHVTRIGGDVTVSANGMLARFAWPAAQLAPGSRVSVRQNPALPECEVSAWLAAQPSSWQGSADLAGNAACSGGQP